MPNLQSEWARLREKASAIVEKGGNPFHLGTSGAATVTDQD
jgi:hypothetical protein